MAIDRKKFFDGYHASFGQLSQEQVDGLNQLIDFIEADSANDQRNTFRKQTAYLLATIKHETADTFHPIDEIGSSAYFNNRYGPQTEVGRSMGNLHAGDGAKYHGRGYCQLTGKKNYQKAAAKFNEDCVSHPEKVKEPHLAYLIISTGMREGWFTGHKLDNYIGPTTTDYYEARRIVNRLDQAEKIKNYAILFDHILSSSFIPANESTQIETSVSPQSADSSKATEQEPDDDWTGDTAFVDSESPSASDAVAVSQVSAEKEETKEVKGIGASIGAAVTFLTTTGAGILTWLEGSRPELIYAFFGSAALIGAIFIIYRFRYASSEKERAHAERMQREKQAFELQLALINSAARKDLNTVTIKPMPIKNSEV